MSREQALQLTLPRLTDRLAVGDAGLRVSPFCLGRVRSEDAVAAAFDAGINFFFLSADMHWPLYEASRRGLQRLLARGKSMRDRIVIAAVCYPTQPEFCSAPFEELLDATPGLERIDVLVAGGSYAGELSARLPVYQDHRRTGFVGAQAIGTTCHDREAARQVITEGLVDVAFIRYNPVHAGAREDLFPHLLPRPRSLLFNFKSTHGFVRPERLAALGLHGDVYWHPEVTDYYRFALSRPEIDGLLLSPGTSGEVDALARAVEQGPLDEEEETYLMGLAAVADGAARVSPEDARFGADAQPVNAAP